MVGVLKGELARVGGGITQEFTLSAYTKRNEEKKPSVFLLGHVREPLAKIIIYKGGEREEEGEGGREREAKAFYYSGHW